MAHEEHDAILRLAGKSGRFDGERVDDGRSGPRLACQEVRERDPAEAVEHPSEKLPAAGTVSPRPPRVWKWIIRHTQTRWH